MMERDWLWDRKISIEKVKEIFKNPLSKEFLYYSALLLSRKNEPREVLKFYLKPDVFCSNWQRIKKEMRKDKWAVDAVEFWQAVYEKLRDKYKTKVQKKEITVEPICRKIGENIKKIRKERKLTQKQLAISLNVSQQLVSRLEKGYENPSIITLKKIAAALNIQIDNLIL